jgi:hypothetical protein
MTFAHDAADFDDLSWIVAALHRDLGKPEDAPEWDIINSVRLVQEW